MECFWKFLKVEVFKKTLYAICYNQSIYAEIGQWWEGGFFLFFFLFEKLMWKIRLAIKHPTPLDLELKFASAFIIWQTGKDETEAKHGVSSGWVCSIPYGETGNWWGTGTQCSVFWSSKSLWKERSASNNYHVAKAIDSDTLTRVFNLKHDDIKDGLADHVSEEFKIYPLEKIPTFFIETKSEEKKRESYWK